MDETNNLASRERSNLNSTESLQRRSPFQALDLEAESIELPDKLADSKIQLLLRGGLPLPRRIHVSQ